MARKQSVDSTPVTVAPVNGSIIAIVRSEHFTAAGGRHHVIFLTMRGKAPRSGVGGKPPIKLRARLWAVRLSVYFSGFLTPDESNSGKFPAVRF